MSPCARLGLTKTKIPKQIVGISVYRLSPFAGLRPEKTEIPKQIVGISVYRPAEVPKLSLGTSVNSSCDSAERKATTGANPKSWL